MDNYAIRIRFSEKELKEIMDELTEAQHKIYDCYSRLRDIGYAEVIEAASDEG